MEINGPVTWTKEYRQKLIESYTAISQSDPFAKLRGMMRASELIDEMSKDGETE